jgi:antitoxin YefM
MAKYLTITEARQHLLNLPDELKDEPVMAALSFEQYESLLETLSVLGDRSFADTLQVGKIKVTVGAKGTWNSTENL